MDKWPAAARLQTAAGHLPTATDGGSCSYTTPGGTTSANNHHQFEKNSETVSASTPSNSSLSNRISPPVLMNALAVWSIYPVASRSATATSVERVPSSIARARSGARISGSVFGQDLLHRGPDAFGRRFDVAVGKMGIAQRRGPRGRLPSGSGVNDSEYLNTEQAVAHHRGGRSAHSSSRLPCIGIAQRA